MTLERSVLLLVLTLAGLYVLPRLLPRKPRLRRGLQVLCIMAAMLDAAYILLTLLSGGTWTAAVVFLILFEHVAVVPAEGEDDEGSVERERAV